jgi:predicted DNA-binding helix-hairpin-helix protein
MLLRVPGLGVKAVDRLLLARRVRRLRAGDLKRLHVPTGKVMPFVIVADHRPSRSSDPIQARPHARAIGSQAALF